MANPSTAHDLSVAENGTLQNGSTSKLYGANPPPAWSHCKLTPVVKEQENEPSFTMHLSKLLISGHLWLFLAEKFKSFKRFSNYEIIFVKSDLLE